MECCTSSLPTMRTTSPSGSMVVFVGTASMVENEDRMVRLIEGFEVEVKLCWRCYLTTSATTTDLAACYGLDLGQKISDRVTLIFRSAGMTGFK